MTLKELKKYKIVVKDGAGECNLYAAENLVNYVKITCGVKLKVVKDNSAVSAPFFSIGETAQFKKATGDFDRKTLIHNGFRIFKDKNNNIYFDGLTPRAVMYAVFDFIEVELGCRFYTWRVEKVPKVTEIDLSKIDRVSIPSFELGTEDYNEVFGQGGPKSNIKMDFYCKLRVRDLFTSPWIEEKYGGPFAYCARNDFHNFHYYCPPAKYVNKHPEWYRFLNVNGGVYPTIDLTNGVNEDGTLDESMEESVAKVVIAEFKKDLDANPNAEIFGFTQEDSSLNVDNEKNRDWETKIGRSGILIRFCNLIIRELNKYAKEKYNKTVKLATFAYSNSRYAPMKTVDGKRVPIDETCICDENLIIQFALFGNSYYSYFDPKQRAEIKEIIADWRQIAKRFWFWGYDIDFAHYHYYCDSFHTINDNMRGFKDLGIEYLFMECGGGAANWQTQMRGYAYLKKLWNVDLDANALIDEYIDYVYNITAHKMREFMDVFHQNYKAINDAGEREVYFTTRGSCEDVINNPIEMLLKALKITDEMYDIVNKSKLSKAEKKDMIRRVAEVRMTPLKMIYNKFYDYYPNETKENRIRLRDEFIKTARLLDVPEERVASGGGWKFFTQYIPEMEEIHGKYEAGQGKGDQHAAGYVPDDI